MEKHYCPYPIGARHIDNEVPMDGRVRAMIKDHTSNKKKGVVESLDRLYPKGLWQLNDEEEVSIDCRI